MIAKFSIKVKYILLISSAQYKYKFNTFMCAESCLRDIFLFHPYLVISEANVKFSENIDSLNFIQEISLTGMVNLSLMVSLLRAQKLGHMHQVPSLFKTMIIGDKKGIILGYMTPASNSSSMIFSI